ncbi:hypothetical protein [Yoonia sediminilitoris]|uniref:Uncharacterized protein n=1 Tax=Yoonia sediminilitoris TaxID=1286148 RepID=A0A2T6K926_9RHOB|nr:hypothetical protein [Yoonia sediminilitoris]PUB11278.1 hypothetical protein C8N45_11451 [Yoonia sediminilitoris]RCW91094.1 hypothetical protein DFP92_11451 [Yoonia sediminilitoris]
MPIDKLVLILVSVIAAAGATIWVAAILLASVQVSPVLGLTALGLIAICAYIAWRIIADRLTNSDDNHYDKFEN